MCKLMTTAEMPTNLNSKGEPKKNYIAWFPKPNNDGENVRGRLLWFLSPNKNSRNVPYFSQMVHDHWGVTEKGTQIVDDTIICPSTKYSSYDKEKWIKNEKTGKNDINCPICRKMKEAMAVWKNSGWKDKSAMKRYFALQPKFRGIVPIYIINDPNNPKNNNRMKVMILTNKEDYDKFDQIVKAEKAKAYMAAQKGKPYEIFNGKDAVDIYFHFETVEETKKNGFVQKTRKMTGIAFDDPNSKYDIPDICKDKLDMFDMDEQFYVSNTSQDLEDFYHKYYAKDETVIPKENVDIFKKMQQNNATNVEETVKVDNPHVETETVQTEVTDTSDVDDSIQTERSHTEEFEEKSSDEQEDITAEIMADLADI